MQMRPLTEQEKKNIFAVAIFAVLPVLTTVYIMREQANTELLAITASCERQMQVDAKFMGQLEQYLVDKKAAMTQFRQDVVSQR